MRQIVAVGGVYNFTFIFHFHPFIFTRMYTFKTKQTHVSIKKTNFVEALMKQASSRP